MTESVRVLIPEEEVNKRIKEMAEKISADIGDETITLICILKGSVFFSCELAKNIKGSVMLDFMSVTSYGDDTKSSGVVKIIKDLDDPLEGKNVLAVSYTHLWRADGEKKESRTEMERYGFPLLWQHF